MDWIIATMVGALAMPGVRFSPQAATEGEGLVRLFGVPFDAQEQNRLSEHYLQRRAEKIRKEFPDADGAALVLEAVQQITGDLDDYLNQIASRSQTLLAVIAIFIAAFLQIGSSVPSIKWLCIVWSVISLSLFYNIWLFFGPTNYYISQEHVYRQTVKLAYRRSIIFNGNIAASILFCILLIEAYVLNSFLK